MFIAALFTDIYTIATHGNNVNVHQWMNKENVDTHTHRLKKWIIIMPLKRDQEPITIR